MKANPETSNDTRNVLLHVITGLRSGGAERMLTRIVTQRLTECDTTRHIVVSLIDEGVYGAEIRAAGVELHCLRMRNILRVAGSSLQLARLIRRYRPKLVMTWLYHADLLGVIAASLTKVPTLIWNIRCSDMNFHHYGWSMRWIVKLLATLSRRPSVVVVNSQAGIKAHKRLGYAPCRWLYLPNGFDLAEWCPGATDRTAVRAELGVRTDDVLIAMIARKDPKKDHALFFEAALRVATHWPQSRFVLIGYGTDKLPVSQELKKNLRCLGERQDIARLLRGLDGLVLCSAYGEGFPNIVGEAMATAVPCIVTDVGDSALLVGDCGWVVPPRSPDALAAAMEKMIAAKPEERYTLGMRARQRIAENWSIGQVRLMYQALWEEFI